MIRGEKKEEISTDIILQRLTSYDIFRYYMMGRNWKINKATHSPFRSDDNPSFIIGNKYGFLYFVDFATGQRGDCFEFVKELYNLASIHDACKQIDRDFGLGLTSTTNIGKYQRIKKGYKQPEEEIGKKYSIIQVITRPFTKEELDYWNCFHQDVQDLKNNNVFSVDKVFLNKQRFPLKATELRFGYLYGNSWKIYRPFADKKSKWIPNNVPITTMEGKDNITNCDVAIISKSKKDMMVLKKVFPCVCAVQNESIACFSKENIEFLKANSNRQILSFDSDITGVKNSQQITKLFDFGYCNVPRKYLSEDVKDWAELARRYNLSTIEKFLKEKGILRIVQD